MVEFKCTVKDIFRRTNMIDKAVRRMADNGYTGYAATYALVRDNIFNALEYASERMKDYEYTVAVNYLNSRQSEQTVADNLYYTHRTIRRYIRKGCDLIGEYYEKCLGIRLLPCDTRAVECKVSAGSFWEKADSLMSESIENACVAILCCNEHKSINYVCNTYGMGSVKIKNIVREFNSVVTISDIPEEERSVV